MFGVDIPISGFSTQELNGSCRIVHRRGQRMLAGQSIVDGCTGNPFLEIRANRLWLLSFVAGHPASAMNDNQQRARSSTFRLPEVEHISSVRPVGEISMR